MKERPILFSGERVTAILEGHKTLTRRAIKPQPPNGEGVHTCHYCESNWSYTTDGGACACRGITNRYGNPGDRLWVKETFAILDAGIAYRMTGSGWTDKMKWKPSIFMPRYASRLTLEIIDTRVERLQSITLEDAQREGVETTDQFAELWIRINGQESWDSNPFVWVIEFKKLEGDQA